MKATQPGSPLESPVPDGVLDRALALVAYLRVHCPWDAAQTPASLQKHLLEEAHEVVDAITVGDEAELQDELGDLLLNLAFQIVLAEERGAFDRTAVAEGLEHKLVRRHPHLFGHGEAEPWDSIKARERRERAASGAAGTRAEEGSSLLSGLVPGSDPLLRAQRLQERVARVGFDWPDARSAWDKLHEEVEELRAELEGGSPASIEEELGDLLFSVVNLARLAGANASVCLARANAKFTRRFQGLERLAHERGTVLEEAGLEALDRLWDEAKGQERGA